LKVLLPFSDNHHVALENAAWFGCFENVEFLLSSGQCGNNHIQALSFAVYKSMGTLEEETKSSYEKIIKKLWPFSDLDNLYVDVIEEAFYRKNQKWIDFCWPKFFANLQSQKKASDLDHWTAVRAAQNGYTDFLQQMLPFIDTSVWDDYIIHQAAKYKQWDCVKILIDLYDGDWAELASWIVLYGQFHLFEELKIPFDRHQSEGAQEIWQSVGQEAQSIHVQDLFEHQDFSNAVYFLLGLLPTNHDALIQELLNLMPEILEDFGLRSKIVKLNHQVAFSIYQEKFPHDPYWSDFIMAALQYANIDILNNVLSKYPNRWENKWIAEAQTNKNSE
jgi:hypothetical protein